MAYPHLCLKSTLCSPQILNGEVAPLSSPIVMDMEHSAPLAHIVASPGVDKSHSGHAVGGDRFFAGLSC
jgi:hypothetical protein